MVEKSIGNIKLCASSRCTGCTACMCICPTGSITMQENIWAELHPVINKETCIGCGLCMKTCPQLQELNYNTALDCYAAWRINDSARMDSSSGGIAALLAESVIRQQGVYYGVTFERNAGAHFTRIDKVNDISKTKGSKYVQASLNRVFEEIGHDLSCKREVVFVGSPCQVAGLRAYIANSRYSQYREKLLAVDFLCHGTVPQKYFLEYLDYLEKQQGCHIDYCVFRSNRPEENYYLTLMEQNHVCYKKKAERDKYFYSFLKGITCRDSCIDCQFKSEKRVGDITIGDFIGLGRDSYFEFKNGINPSLVLVNTELGKTQIATILNQGEFVPRPVEEAVKGGPSLKRETMTNRFRPTFKKHYVQGGFIRATLGLEMLMLVDEKTAKIKNVGRRCINKVKKVMKGQKQ